MARRPHSRLPDYRLTSDLSQQSGRFSSSSSVLTSRTPSPSSLTSYSLATHSSITAPASRPLLGSPRSFIDATGDERDTSAISESRLSPKPNIRKYGRTTHSQAFASSSAESPSAPSVIIRQQRELPASPSAQIRPLDGGAKVEKNGEDTLGTFVHERRRLGATEMESGAMTPRRLRHVGKQAGADDQTPGVVSVDEEARRGARLEGESSCINRSSVGAPGRENEIADSERSLRRLRRSLRLEGKDIPQPASTAPQRASVAVSKNGSGVADADTVSKRSDSPTGADVKGSRDRRSVVNKLTDEGSSRNIAQVSAEVKIFVVAPDDADSRQHTDGELDEPPCPATDRLSGHAGQPAKREWTEEDLDEFVRQLSNPQRQLTRQSSGQQVLQSGGRRAVLTRSATEAVSQTHDTDTSFSEGDTPSRNGDGESTSGGLISGFSGLRLMKNKKMIRSSQAQAKRSAMLKSRQNHHTVSSLLFPNDADDGEDATSSSGGDVPYIAATDPCGSSPEGSDGEGSGIASRRQPTTSDVSKDPKKGRFRKMLTRPLKRSQSAGCAKDVPAHALFLENQPMKSKDAEWVEALKPRASEGDIRVARQSTYHEDVDDDDGTDSQRSHIGRIHKTNSADSAMMAAEDISPSTQLSAVSQPKHKSRNIAKKISKKLFLRRRHTDSTLGLIEKGEGVRRLATVDPEEAKQWSKSFENLLFDKTGLELFRGFLLTEHSDENIEFWIACQNYKHAKSSKQLPAMAVKIFNDYVAVQSKREINLDSRTRNYTYESVTGNPTRQTFDEAQRRVQALMEKDSYRRFLESEIYHDLATGNIQHKS